MVLFFHRLDLQPDVLQAPAFGDVPRDARHHRGPVRMNRAERQFDGKLCAIRSHCGYFDALTNQGALPGPDVTREPLPVGIAMRRRHDELGKLAPDHVAFPVAKRLLRRGIELHHSPGCVNGDDAIERHLDDCPVEGLTRPQRLEGMGVRSSTRASSCWWVSFTSAT